MAIEWTSRAARLPSPGPPARARPSSPRARHRPPPAPPGLRLALTRASPRLAREPGHAHAEPGAPSHDGLAAPSCLPAPGRLHGPVAHVLAPRARCAPPSPPRRPTLRVQSHAATLAGPHTRRRPSLLAPSGPAHLRPHGPRACPATAPLRSAPLTRTLAHRRRLNRHWRPAPLLLHVRRPATITATSLCAHSAAWVARRWPEVSCRRCAELPPAPPCRDAIKAFRTARRPTSPPRPPHRLSSAIKGPPELHGHPHHLTTDPSLPS
ncbi:serine/arginine repetitive matrix protein 1-like [Panicum virgatum]|uniref:serine/arginine repetitive matrix protein 1-like n=1 Tax=Panicum virgatum TaxID=38727 RepID=UPI0019D51AF3|nr:serine/arginine repetitive matrix protein 1-like [Panicum virgatum]